MSGASSDAPPRSADDAAGASAGRAAGTRAPSQPTDWSALVRLAVAVGMVVAVFVLLGGTALLVVILAVIAMVMIHELGHFATAKWSHMKVTEYFLGFGPRLWSIRRGETEYGIKAIPAGGYVKIPGMTSLEKVEAVDEERTYRRQPFHRRIIVASAGSFMHLVMALLLAYGAVLYFGVPAAVRVPISGFVTWSGHAQTAAQVAGLRKGDVVVAVDGRRLADPTQFTAAVQRSAGRPVRLTVERAGRLVTLTVVPAAGHETPAGKEILGAAAGGRSIGLIGVELGQPTQVFSSEGPLRAAGTAVVDVGRDTAATFRAIPGGFASLYRDILSPRQAVKDARTGQRAESIVGAIRTATQAEQQGILTLIEVLIALNIVIGIVNMLPMLPLDGGHVAVAVYERVRTRRGRPYYQADASKLLPVAYAFVAVLGVVVAAAVYLDIVHPIANPFG
ncbi:MAG: M50 family metallopeptidase [Acidimicrobiales bacterium]